MQEQEETIKGTVHLKDGSVARIDIDYLAEFLETNKDNIVVRKFIRRGSVRGDLNTLKLD
ncbi:MAG: hypothetical protein AN485_16185 [Anabaena sp. MDT14b]|mgnify:CR=1 FL=1|jgi:hypothetical protein|uniref:Uncharacterized protein n=1 Tax=Aphanizomenon flos-aquae WA102 TaxID=1710896 RepID=A0A1B7X2T7_APHFL|nr:MAG: hypothetical protein AN485_16185 [Anabaena sp. MDT14b]OBQ43610.1 MAG: hypothetical protein AN484_11440 [Aphanizomenon flos-aquae WA102]